MPAGLHGLRYANWRLAGAERGSAELRGTLAPSHRSLLLPLKLTPLPALALFPTSPLQLSTPHASQRQRGDVCLCVCWNAASPSAWACM